MYSNFVSLAKEKSYYGDSDSYEKVCGLKPDEKYNLELSDWMNTFPQSIQYIEHKYSRIFWMYLLEIIFGLAILYYLERRKKLKRQNLKRNKESTVEMINNK